MYIESRSLAVSGPQHTNGQFADDADAANASPPDALGPLPDLRCVAAVAFPGASGSSRAHAGMAANQRDRARIARRGDRAPAHSMLAKNRRVCAADFPSADNGTRGKPSCSNASNSLSGTAGCSSGEGSHRRKRTWAVATSVHCRNNPRQTMISLSTDIRGPLLDQLRSFSICVPPTRRAADRIALCSNEVATRAKDRWIDLGGRANMLPHLS
jgi:hypothetical protein